MYNDEWLRVPDNREYVRHLNKEIFNKETLNKETMSKTPIIFNINDTVFDANYGIGEIISIMKYSDKPFPLWTATIKVKFGDIVVQYTQDGIELERKDFKISDRNDVLYYRDGIAVKSLFVLEKIDTSKLGDYTELPVSMTKNLYPGQKVLYKTYSNFKWDVGLFSYYLLDSIPENNDRNTCVYRIENNDAKFCIPLYGFEEYAGKEDFPKICLLR